MRRRKAVACAQTVGSISKQRHDGELSSERHEIPWTVDVRHGLEKPNDSDTKHSRNNEIGGRTPQCGEPRNRETRTPYSKSGHHEDANCPAPAAVQERFHPPIVGTDPLGL